MHDEETLPGKEIHRTYDEYGPIQVFDDGTKRRLEGLYTVNQDAVRTLPDANVIDLFRRGYLQLIYLMIASLKQVPVLARKKNAALLKATSQLGA